MGKTFSIEGPALRRVAPLFLLLLCGTAQAQFNDVEALPAPNGDGEQDIYARSFETSTLVLTVAGEWTIRVVIEQEKSPGWATCFPIQGGSADYEHEFTVSPASGCP